MAKICQICGTDCSAKPRTKDNKGRYFCKECYEKALRATKAKRAKLARREQPANRPEAPAGQDAPPSSAPSKPPRAPETELIEVDEHGRPKFKGSLLEAALEDQQTAENDDLVPEGEPPKICQSCGKEVAFDTIICTKCGFNFKTGQVVSVLAGSDAKKTDLAGRLRDVAEQLQTPGGIAFVALIVFGLLFAVSFFFDAAALVYAAATGLLGLGIWVLVLIEAFRSKLIHGLVSLLIPPYSLVFLFVYCEDARPKLLFGVCVIAIGGFFALQVITGKDVLAPFIKQ